MVNTSTQPPSGSVRASKDAIENAAIKDISHLLWAEEADGESAVSGQALKVVGLQALRERTCTTATQY